MDKKSSYFFPITKEFYTSLYEVIEEKVFIIVHEEKQFSFFLLLRATVSCIWGSKEVLRFIKLCISWTVFIEL